MSDILITIDTELSAGLHRRGMDADANLASSVFGRTGVGEYGIGWQMDVMDAHGCTGVFFVDPMPALIHGDAAIAAIVAPIVARGHEVQLHIHTEWLEWVDRSPVGGRTGRNIGDFTRDDQHVLLGEAAATLERVGAPYPSAFRAGNYGADDATLVALADLGIGWDSSFNAAYADRGSAIALPPDTVAPVRRHGVIEIPVGGVFDRPGHVRPTQVCALSSWEMRAALAHAAASDAPPLAVVTHSFEMLSRDRRQPNLAVAARFERMCATIAGTPGLRSVGFRDLDPAIADRAWPRGRLRANPVRTAARMAAQGVAHWRYERG